MRFLCNSHFSISNSQTQPFKPKRYSFSHLQTATKNFSQSTLLGKGSHGAVYLATFSNTSTFAVKLPNSSVTETLDNELQILLHVRTPRIVNLIGYAVNSNVSAQKLLLVVEYMPNGSLYDLLHKNPNPPGLLTRVRFLLQVAKAVRTLHVSDPPVMHRDIKSSNVLIDERGNARLSDFGLAIKGSVIKGSVSDVRAMSTPPAGTLGYLDPCYLAPGDLSTKIDVFSFGILLFEVLSGRKAIDVEFSPAYIVEWALPLVKSGGYQGVIDRRISGWEGVHRTVVRELCLLGAKCVRSTAEKRPSVGEIVDCLKKVYGSVKLKRFNVWRNLRRRMRHVERSWPLDYDNDEEFHDWERNNKRGCNVEEGLTRGGNQAVRTKSIGSFREIAKLGPDVLTDDDDMIKVKRKVQLTVKKSAVKLSKSRSMNVVYRGKNSKMEVNKEQEVLPLLVVNSKGSKIETIELEKLEEQVQ